MGQRRTRTNHRGRKAVTPKPPVKLAMQWVGGHAFEGGRKDGPKIILDGDSQRGPGPVETLLLALAACTGYDIVDILEKRRTPVSAIEMNVHAERFDGVPSRVTSVVLTYDISGNGVELTHAERAVELAITKYCSVRDSLDPNMTIQSVVRVHPAA